MLLRRRTSTEQSQHTQPNSKNLGTANFLFFKDTFRISKTNLPDCLTANRDSDLHFMELEQIFHAQYGWM